tara:strand:- start:3064 stop:3300 length:237 start_codon:yes stop_codon:yes gene_type:complete
MGLIISEYSIVIAKNLDFNVEGKADTFDIIELAIQIGEDNCIYDNGNWNDINRKKCFDKAHEIEWIAKIHKNQLKTKQ